MGKVIQFNRKDGSDSSVKLILYRLRDSLDLLINNSNYFKEDEEYVNVFRNRLSRAIMYLKNNGWKDAAAKERFVEVFNYINRIKLEPDDFLGLYNRLFQNITLFHITDMNPLTLTSANEYVSGIIDVLDNNYRSQLVKEPLTIREYLKVLNNKKLQQLILLDGEDLIEENIEDVCGLVDSGTNMQEILTIYSSIDTSVDDISTGIITIDRIKKYYSYITDIVYTHELDDLSKTNEERKELYEDYESYISTFDRIHELNSIDEKSQSNYIYFIQQIRGCLSNGIFDELAEVKALTNLYLEYKSKLFGVNSDSIMPLVKSIVEKKVTDEQVKKFILRDTKN